MLSEAGFGTLFSALNNDDGHSFRRWLFRAGMAYGDLDFWWPASRQKRPSPHEGIDFFCYEDNRDRVHYLAQSLVPAPCGARVVAICPDFMGQSIFLLPEQRTEQQGLYVLGHISPDVLVGQVLKQGDAVGRVTAPKGAVPGHLHVSFLSGDWRQLPLELSWPALLAQQKLRFIQPF